MTENLPADQLERWDKVTDALKTAGFRGFIQAWHLPDQVFGDTDLVGGRNLHLVAAEIVGVQRLEDAASVPPALRQKTFTALADVLNGLGFEPTRSIDRMLEDPAPGMVRMYRGNKVRSRERADTSRFWDNSDAFEGNWFTGSLPYAEIMLRSGPWGGQIVYVDVPEEVARNARVSNQSVDLQLMTIAGQSPLTLEFVLPSEWARQAQRLPLQAQEIGGVWSDPEYMGYVFGIHTVRDAGPWNFDVKAAYYAGAAIAPMTAALDKRLQPRKSREQRDYLRVVVNFPLGSDYVAEIQAGIPLEAQAIYLKNVMSMSPLLTRVLGGRSLIHHLAQHMDVAVTGDAADAIVATATSRSIGAAAERMNLVVREGEMDKVREVFKEFGVVRAGLPVASGQPVTFVGSNSPLMTVSELPEGDLAALQRGGETVMERLGGTFTLVRNSRGIELSGGLV